jgi:hypothetical protein
MEREQQVYSRRGLLRAGGGLGLMALGNAPGLWRNVCHGQPPGSDEFTFVFMTDSHLDMKCSRDDLQLAATWIADNAQRLNLRYVAHQGDVGDKRGSGSIAEMLKLARQALNPIVKARIPCSIAIGNHDYDFQYDGRACTAFNHHDAFGAAFYADRPWFKGTYESETTEPGLHPGGTANHYFTQEIAGRKFLFLVLEFFPRDKVMTWADDLVRNRIPDHDVIVTTHAYLDNTGELIDDVRAVYSGFAGNTGGEYSNTGKDLWNKYFKNWRNLRMVTSGHIHTAPRQRYVQKIGVHGNTVHTHFWNHQNWIYRDGAFHYIKSGEHQTLMLKIFKVSPANNRVMVENYLPLLGLEGEPAMPASYAYQPGKRVPGDSNTNLSPLLSTTESSP